MNQLQLPESPEEFVSKIISQCLQGQEWVLQYVSVNSHKMKSKQKLTYFLYL